MINFHITENQAAHKTENYPVIEELVLRRGEVFDVTVKFNRDYNPDSDVITLLFVSGKWATMQWFITSILCLIHSTS